MFVNAKDSPAQLLHHSELFRERFHAFVAAEAVFDTRAAKDLRAAKHRFESYQKPVGRCAWCPVLS